MKASPRAKQTKTIDNTVKEKPSPEAKAPLRFYRGFESSLSYGKAHYILYLLHGVKPVDPALYSSLSYHRTLREMDEFLKEKRRERIRKFPEKHNKLFYKYLALYLKHEKEVNPPAPKGRRAKEYNSEEDNLGGEADNFSPDIRQDDED